MNTHSNTPIAELKKLSLAENRQKHPNLPEYARVTPRYSDKTSNGLTKMVIDYIRLNGGQAERISITGRLIDNRKQYTDVIGRTRVIGSTKWIKPSMQRGTADISACLSGKSIKIEIKCKSTKDKQRPAQKEYQKQVEAAGGIYLLISSFDEFYNWFQNEGRKA